MDDIRDSKKLRYILMCLFIAVSFTAVYAAKQDGVLLLNSYHYGYDWSDMETRAFNDVFNKPGPNTGLYIEYMDDKRYTGYFESHFKEWTASKYSNVNFRMLIALDDPAFIFCRKYRAAYFPGVPIVFCGVSDVPSEEIEKMDNVAGAFEDVALRETLDMALKLQPSAAQVYLITDNSLNSRLSNIEMKKLEPLYSPRVKFKYIDGSLTFKEYYARIASVGPGQIVIYRGFVTDAEKSSQGPGNVVLKTCELSRSPVYVTKTDELGTGAIGGMLRDGYEHGLCAAKTAMRILDGAPISGFKKVFSPGSKPWLDYAVAKKMGIDTSLAPKGTNFKNREESFFVKNFRVLVVSGALIAAQAVIIIFLVINIRKRVRAEKALVDTAAELSRANEELKYFSYAASHDLKEPLRQIKINAQLVQRGMKDGADSHDRESLRYIIEGIDRMAALLSSIYNYTIINRKQIARKDFKLRAAAEMAAANLADRIISTGARVENLIDENTVVYWNFENTVLLFQNLFSNSIKFRSKEQPHIRVCIIEKGAGKWVCEVKDNGIGVDPAYKSKIFGLFEQMHPRDRYEGSGLGLAICERIVSKYGGKIWLESEGVEGTGSAVYFTLPPMKEGG